MSDQIRVRKLNPAIGAEVTGVDLTHPLSAFQIESVRKALLENLVLFFRDQNLSPAQHKIFARRFGDLHIHPAPLGILDGDPEIIIVEADANSRRIAGEVWHSDVSCDSNPPMASILHLKEVPPVGGDTIFASMYAAYEALSDSMRRFLSGLTAMHDGRRNYDGRATAPSRAAEYPRAEHPVVRTHPITGRNALFVNRMFTTHIVQLKDNESAAVLELLYRHVERPEFQCRFRWEPNSIAFWDNRCVQHQALWDYFPARRYGHRVTIAGDRPFFRPDN
ncbi:MAG TPA: TauD/TfdA family dioxygenase [Candidatus Binataceae bacterium]|nr:TauD/TfdA family dioxygenase [Candidatus Binataceae bacterium]